MANQRTFLIGAEATLDIEAPATVDSTQKQHVCLRVLALIVHVTGDNCFWELVTLRYHDGTVTTPHHLVPLLPRRIWHLQQSCFQALASDMLTQ
jgi:hypothetical protein